MHHCRCGLAIAFCKRRARCVICQARWLGMGRRMEDCRRAPDAASSLQRRALPTNGGKSGRRRKPLRFQRGDDTVTTRLGDSPVGKVFWRAGKNLPFLQARPFLQSKNFKAGKFYVSVISGSAEGDRAARGFKSGGGYFLMGDCDGMNDNASKTRLLVSMLLCTTGLGKTGACHQPPTGVSPWLMEIERRRAPTSVPTPRM